MKHRYNIGDYYHFGRMFWRNRRRHQVWQKQFEASVRDQSFKLPAAAVVQFIPTEACNLRCPMCNQWGENGYFLDGTRRSVKHMDESALKMMVENFSPRASLINIHGGEPLAYKHIDELLEILGEKGFDVLLTTNGTLMKDHLEPLAAVKNLAIILSVDGDEESHDRVRGKGRFQQTREGITALFNLRRRLKMPLPLVIMSIVVCEWTTDVIDKAYAVARDFGVFALNYNLRYFMPEEAGLAYEKHLQEQFGLKSSGAWRGWIAPKHEQHDYRLAASHLNRLLRRNRFRLLPPFTVAGPDHLRGKDFEDWFTDYSNTFGNESCFMPFYWARVQANGDLIFCPGHPDIIAGNVFRDSFMSAFNSELAIRFRRHILNNRMPICNRCCGLYMTNQARPFEQKARRNLGLPKEVNVHWP